MTSSLLVGRQQNRPYTINFASPQAAGLKFWLPALRQSLTPFEMVSGLIFSPYSTGPSYANQAILGQMLEMTTARATSMSLPAGPTNFNIGTSDFTVTAWVVKGTYTGTFAYFFNAADLSFRPLYFNDGTGQLRIGLNGTFYSPSGGANVADGLLHHIAVSADRSGLASFYVDGKLDGTPPDISSRSAQNLNFDQVIIGARLSLTDSAFNGKFTDLRLYNRALSAGEIWQIYSPDTRWELYRPTIPIFIVAGVTTPAPVTRTVTATVDARLVQAQTDIATLDTRLVQTKTVSVTPDTRTIQTQTRTGLLDSVLKAAQAKTIQTDAGLVKTLTRTAQADTTRIKAQTVTAQADARQQKAQTATAAIDAPLVKTLAATATLDTVLLATKTATVTADSAATREQTAAVQTDAGLVKTQAQTGTFDALLLATGTVTAATDTAAIRNQAATVQTDTNLVQTLTATCAVDVLLQGDAGTISVKADSRQVQNLTLAAGADTVLRQAGTVAAQADTRQVKGQTGVTLLDAVLLANQARATQADTGTVQEQVVATEADTGLVKALAVTTQADTYLSQPTGLVTVQADSRQVQVQVTTCRVDAYLSPSTLILGTVYLLGKLAREKGLLGQVEGTVARDGRVKKTVSLLGSRENLTLSGEAETTINRKGRS